MQDAKAKVPDSASNDDKLALYGLFKQATVGDVDTKKPGIFDQKGVSSLNNESAFPLNCTHTIMNARRNAQAKGLVRQAAQSGRLGRSRKARTRQALLLIDDLHTLVIHTYDLHTLAYFAFWCLMHHKACLCSDG